MLKGPRRALCWPHQSDLGQRPAQVMAQICRWETVHYTRLVIEQGSTTFSLAFHPRLTVVAGVDAGARKGLVAELLGGLASNRSGVNLELVDDRGRKLAVLRPTSGEHRVIDVSIGSDASDEFRSDDGGLDVLNRYGIDIQQARDEIHLERSHLDTETKQDPRIERLAEMDQTTLWSTAARVRITEDEMTAVAEATASSFNSPDVVSRIEDNHQGLEAAVEQHRRLQREASIVCAVSLLAALPVAMVKPVMAVPILVVGMATILLAFIMRGRVESMRRSERTMLAEAGADSYVGYMVGRVNEMMDGSETHRRRSAVAEDHRYAAARWTQLVGDVSVEWALAHHEAIENAAKLRKELESLSRISTTATEVGGEVEALALSVMSHMTKLRSLGSGGESLPLILDDPFGDVDSATKLTMLELLARSSGSPQVIVLTNSEDVASWARLEALTGEVALVEPSVSNHQAATPTAGTGSDHLAV